MGANVVERTPLLGVDAGSAHVAAVLADLSEGEPQVIGVSMVPCSGIRKGLVVDLEATAAAIRQAAAAACEMAGKPGVTRAVLGVSGNHVRSMVGSAEVQVFRPSHGVAPEDIRRALDAAAVVDLPQGRQVVHVVPRSYVLDGADGLVDPLGLAGRALEAEAHLITGEALAIENCLRAASRAGLDVFDYQLAVRAAGEAVLTADERSAGVLLLDVGAETTGVAVYDRGHLWHVSVLPVGSNHITTDIASLLQTPVALAEQLKLERGWAAESMAPDTTFELVTPSGLNVREVEDKKLAGIIESRVQEILQLAAEQVKRSGYAGLFPAGLVLTGGGSRLRGLTEVAADCLGLPARAAAPAGPLADSPEFATAVGLVHWGARLAQDEAAVAAEEVHRDKWGRLRGWLKGLFR